MIPPNILELAKAAEIELSRRECLESTWEFRRAMFKAQYGYRMAEWEHQRLIAETLDKVYAGEITRLIINIAPRYGKTDVAVKDFIAKGLAHNPAAKFIHLSYSDELALDNSEQIKEMVKHPSYQERFPGVEVKKGSDSKKKWYTTAGGGVYATAAAGQVTGFGAGRVEVEDQDEGIGDAIAWLDPGEGFSGAIVIDDPIKPEDAESEQIRERVNKRFDSTIRSRVNSRNTPIIIIMQRLHPNDLAGHVQAVEPGKWHVLSLPSIKADGTALCPDKHTIEELLELQRIDRVTFERQHMQNPKPREGLLYKPFRTYANLPGTGPARAFTDVADTGDDSLCQVVYKRIGNLAYVIDVLHTRERAEVTEASCADMLGRHSVSLSRVESNNGGRFFMRNVQALCRQASNLTTRFEPHHQRKNKEARILNNASQVNNFFLFPEGWERLWPSFYNEITYYMAVGSNKHDDAPDVLTAIYEHEVVAAGSGYRRAN